MPIYAAPVDEVRFLLERVLVLAQHQKISGSADLSPEMTTDVLSAAAAFCEEALAPLNVSGDGEGCVRHPDGRVTTPAGFRDAYRPCSR